MPTYEEAVKRVQELKDEIRRWRAYLEFSPEPEGRTSMALEKELKSLKEHWYRTRASWWEKTRLLGHAEWATIPPQSTTPVVVPQEGVGEVTPSPTEPLRSSEETAAIERVRRRDELELAKLEADLAERGKLSPWEQAQLEELQKARADEASKQRWQGQYQAAQQETLRLMNLLRSPSAEGDKQRMALDWENMRQLTLSNLLTNPNRNWIAIQQTQGQRNPYAPQPQTSDETFEQLRAQVKQADAAKKYADNLEKSYASDPTKSLNFNQQTMIDTAREAWRTSQERYLTAFEQRQAGAERARTGLAPLPPGPGTPEQETAGYWSTPRQTGIGQFEVGEPGTMPEANPLPKIPGWLAQATGISGRVPSPGAGREIAPPSGQMWATLNPIQQAKYAGFVDWAGTKPFEELLHQTQVQLPRSPSLGGTRWTPARQMV